MAVDIIRESAPTVGTISREDPPMFWRCGSETVLCGSEYFTCGASYKITRQSPPAAGTITRESAP